MNTVVRHVLLLDAHPNGDVLVAFVVRITPRYVRRTAVLYRRARSLLRDPDIVAVESRAQGVELVDLSFASNELQDLVYASETPVLLDHLVLPDERFWGRGKILLRFSKRGISWRSNTLQSDSVTFRFLRSRLTATQLLLEEAK